MITDKIDNIDKYKEISPDICAFLKNLDQDIHCGKYWINHDDFANVDIYETKSHEDCVFESHKNYIDIQLVLEGQERLDFIDIGSLSVKVPYDVEKDLIFYYNPEKTPNSIILEKGNFAMLFPYEAHKPQMRLMSDGQNVKKVVIKIKYK